MSPSLKPMKRVCVFCGSRFGVRPEHRAAAEATGRLLAERGLGLVYGGGNVGLMGAVADAALEAGGEVIGVIPAALAGKELAHRGLTELRVVETMHERKAMMSELADGFLALPGGIGTLEEFAEIVTWAVLGIHRKPCALVNTAWTPGAVGPCGETGTEGGDANAGDAGTGDAKAGDGGGKLARVGYYDHLIRFADSMEAEGFFKPVYRGLILVAATPEEALDKLAAHEAPDLPHWAGTAQI